MNRIDFSSILYRHLPEVWRDRDREEVARDALKRLLLVYGGALDAMYRTILQRYYDIFPDFDEDAPDTNKDAEQRERRCQSWVLPYLAQLLDVQPVSPLDDGRRGEIANAILWRQRKGTLEAAERIGEVVAGFEAETLEGWRRVATCVRPGLPPLPAASFGEAELLVTGDAAGYLAPARALHPRLPNGTVDFRCHSRAVRSTGIDPTVQRTRFARIELPAATPPAEAERLRREAREIGVPWRQANRHGAPCFPDSYQDLTVRTADVRTPDWRKGHAHPRRVLLHAPPFEGFCASGAAEVAWAAIRDDVLAARALPAASPLELVSGEGDAVTLRRRDGVDAVRLTGVVHLTVARPWRFENVWFDGELKVSAGRVALDHCAVRRLHSHLIDEKAPVLIARAVLFGALLAPRGWIELEYVTVLGRTVAEVLYASDCIFVRFPRKDLAGSDVDVPQSGCIRYSGLPAIPEIPGPGDPPVPFWMADGLASQLRVAVPTCTQAAPVFVQPLFGQPGCGVLHPATGRAVRFGAEDGAEMGAYHQLRLTLREQALHDKLAEYLPLGIEAVLVPDESLLCAPPAQT